MAAHIAFNFPLPQHSVSDQSSKEHYAVKPRRLGEFLCSLRSGKDEVAIASARVQYVSAWRIGVAQNNPSASHVFEFMQNPAPESKPGCHLQLRSKPLPPIIDNTIKQKLRRCIGRFPPSSFLENLPHPSRNPLVSFELCSHCPDFMAPFF
jgi:hypothetical protein